MRVLLAPGDRLEAGPGRVSVDGVARAVDLSSIAAGIHVVKWNGTAGIIEHTVPVAVIDGEGVARLVRETTFDDFTPYQQFVDAWAVANDPPAPRTLTAAVARKDEVMFDYRKSLQAAGYLHLDGNTYDVDAGVPAVLANILTNVALGLPLPGSHGAELMFWDQSGTGRLLDVESLKKLMQGTRQVLQLKFEVHDAHKASVRVIAGDTSKTVAVRIAEIAAYDHAAGYPDQTWQGVGVTP